jgi:RHS repeat-associated protein
VNCTKYIGEDFCRIVGDPVDVVTGANLDRNLDFKLPGPLPLEWHRYYNSAQNKRLCPLGWGHTHEYDRRLLFDVDGLRYIKPTGKSIGFPALENDGDECARSGVVARRVSSSTYLIREHRRPSMEFGYQGPSPVGLLKRLFRGDSSIRFQYGDYGYLESIIDSLGRTICVRHDSTGRILELILVDARTGKDRAILSFNYDAAGNLIRCVDPYRNWFGFEYDENNRMVSKTDRRGYSFHFDYDKHGRCIRSRGVDGLFDVQLDYSPQEPVTVVTRANGGRWTYSYTAAGTVTRIVDPYGGVWAFNLNSRGRVAEEIDPNGDVTKWIYGSSGELIGKRSSLGQFAAGGASPVKPGKKVFRTPRRALEWEYGDLFLLGKTFKAAPDDSALLDFPESLRTLVRQATGTSGSLAGVNRAAKHRDPQDSARTYDDFGLLVRERGSGEAVRRWTYDAGGNTVKYRDRDGSAYCYEYESSNLRCRRIDPLGHIVSYNSTPTALPAKVTDPGGTSSRYLYDLKDRMVQVWRGESLKEEYRYDKADNLVQKLDGNGNLLLDFEIGPQNLKKVRHLASGAAHTYKYDKHGRYVELATDEFTVQFDYDGFGNRTLDQRNGRGVRHEFVGLQRLARTTVFDRFNISYRKLPGNARLIKDPGGHEHSVRLLGQGLAVRTMSNGSSELTRFDAAGRCMLKAQTRSRGFEEPWIRAYTYSGEGDLLQIEDNLRGPVRYEHDPAHRLNRAIHGQITERYVYDAAGNLLEQPGLSGVRIGRANQLSAANGDEFEYNHRQHVAVRRGLNGATSYTYDSRDMLVRCQTPRGEWQACYDPIGRRITKSFGSNRVDFYWDTDRLAAEVHQDGRVRIYIYADSFAMTPLMFMDYEGSEADPESGSRYFVFSNHLSAPIRVEDEKGNVVWNADLAPYGAAHVSIGSGIEMPLRFPGHYFDSETGLHYNRFRYYSPEIGRYIQSDPVGIAGGLNVYAYTSNPLRRVDVRGLAEPPCDSGPVTEEESEPSPEDAEQEMSVGEATQAELAEAAVVAEGGESAQEQAGYPPPTLEAQDFATRLADDLNDQIQNLDEDDPLRNGANTLGVFTHPDPEDPTAPPSLTVDVSGSPAGVERSQDMLTPTLDQMVDDGTISGYQYGPVAPSQYTDGTTSVCAEPGLGDGARNANAPPPDGMAVVARDPNNDAIMDRYGDPPGNRLLGPCTSCSHPDHVDDNMDGLR